MLKRTLRLSHSSPVITICIGDEEIKLPFGGKNGLYVEEVIKAAIFRLKAQSIQACDENLEAIWHLGQALTHLNSRESKKKIVFMVELVEISSPIEEGERFYFFSTELEARAFCTTINSRRTDIRADFCGEWDDDRNEAAE